MAFARIIAAVAVIAVLAGFAKSGFSQLSGEEARDNLRTGCATMALEFFSNPASRAKKILNAAESRLRASRVYGDDIPIFQRLRISVSELEPAVIMTVRLHRIVLDTGSGRPGKVIVWERGKLGVHGNDQDIYGTLAQLVDEFLVEYLRANPECGR